MRNDNFISKATTTAGRDVDEDTPPTPAKKARRRKDPNTPYQPTSVQRPFERYKRSSVPFCERRKQALNKGRKISLQTILDHSSRLHVIIAPADIMVKWGKQSTRPPNPMVKPGQAIFTIFPTVRCTVRL